MNSTLSSFDSASALSALLRSCPSIYNRTESTVSRSYGYAFSGLYIVGFVCSFIFDGSLAVLILWIPELRRIRINFFVFAMAVGNILYSLTFSVTFCNMAFFSQPNLVKENIMTRSLLFFNAFSLYSLVAMCFEALRYLSLNANVTLKQEIRRNRIRHCACHCYSWCILLGVFCVSLVLAIYCSEDQAVLGSSGGHIPAVRAKMVVFAVLHAYLPLSSMAIAMVIATSFWRSRSKEAPRYMEVVVAERGRGVKLIMLIAGIHILFALPHAGVVTYYLQLLFKFPVDKSGCIAFISSAGVLSNETLRIIHRFSTLFSTLSLNVNGILILVISKRINKSLKLIFHNVLVRCCLRASSPFQSGLSTLDSEDHSLKNAFRIGEQGGISSRIGCTNSNSHMFI